MSSMNVSLTPYLKQFVEGKIGGGRYNNVSEVVREALRLLEQQDIERETKLGYLRAGRDVDNASGDPTPHTRTVTTTEI